MSKGEDRGATPDGDQIRRWNGARTAYTCVDGVDVFVLNRSFRREQGRPDKTRVWTHMNGIVYETLIRGKTVNLFVSGTKLSRKMAQIVRGAKNVKTITFPSTTRTVSDGAFVNASLKSVVLNEGLETLGKQQKYGCEGVFRNTRLRKVKLPSTL